MFENIINFFKKLGKTEKKQKKDSKNTAKERLHLVLAQDRANISADFLEMMKQEIIDVIKKYIDIDEEAIDVRMANKPSEDGMVGAPALYANIPILTIKNEARKLEGSIQKEKIKNDIKEEPNKQNTESEETVEEKSRESNKEDIENKKEDNNNEEKSEAIEEKEEEKKETKEEKNKKIEEVKNEKKDS